MLFRSFRCHGLALRRRTATNPSKILLLRVSLHHRNLIHGFRGKPINHNNDCKNQQSDHNKFHKYLSFLNSVFDGSISWLEIFTNNSTHGAGIQLTDCIVFQQKAQCVRSRDAVSHLDFSHFSTLLICQIFLKNQACCPANQACKKARRKPANHCITTVCGFHAISG